MKQQNNLCALIKLSNDKFIIKLDKEEAFNINDDTNIKIKVKGLWLHFFTIIKAQFSSSYCGLTNLQMQKQKRRKLDSTFKTCVTFMLYTQSESLKKKHHHVL
ncbi:CLUMA_CG021483, isoform A [Clunio marinus]|uniref:CLUMA_CG021483, isoform A n=1 Tax=Clunio marinus TaxID=568069 RepID=A0A1J1J8D6_9DIPT|nr:CLUMA_CG021483, isoform A [Clunio marinus]